MINIVIILISYMFNEVKVSYYSRTMPALHNFVKLINKTLFSFFIRATIDGCQPPVEARFDITKIEIENSRESPIVVECISKFIAIRIPPVDPVDGRKFQVKGELPVRDLKSPGAKDSFLVSVTTTKST
jgi:hypothetical protein